MSGIINVMPQMSNAIFISTLYILLMIQITILGFKPKLEVKSSLWPIFRQVRTERSKSRTRL